MSSTGMRPSTGSSTQRSAHQQGARRTSTRPTLGSSGTTGGRSEASRSSTTKDGDQSHRLGPDALHSVNASHPVDDAPGEEIVWISHRHFALSTRTIAHLQVGDDAPPAHVIM